MKKAFLLILILVIVIAGIAGWIFLGPATGFRDSRKALYIRSSAATKQALLDSLKQNDIVRNVSAFEFLAGRMKVWQNIRPGKYEIKKGMSLVSIIRMLRNGHQTPVNLTITKLRTKDDLARFIGARFESDSAEMMNFLNSQDSLKKFNVDTLTVMTAVIPDTYTYFWNSSPTVLFQKMFEANKRFWTEERRSKASAHGLTPAQAYILSSIVEEESNNHAEQGNIASVYLNRMNKGMPLQADPTIKFALHNFGLKRIYEKYLFVESPYNTYRNKGLPPGPICTPSKKTLEAVLDAPQTDYLYFVANSSFNGTHVFSSSYQEHMQNAHLYQQALNHADSLRKEKEPAR
jgi:UPF0755 protein